MKKSIAEMMEEISPCDSPATRKAIYEAICNRALELEQIATELTSVDVGMSGGAFISEVKI